MARSDEAKQTKSESSVVDARGSLHVPENYRTSYYQFLGSWALPADAGKSVKEIHDVYAFPGVIDAYRKTGHFPEGAVLVKERFHTATQPMTPGIVSHADQLVGWRMLAFGKQLTDQETWGLVHYLRTLRPLKQKSGSSGGPQLTCFIAVNCVGNERSVQRSVPCRQPWMRRKKRRSLIACLSFFKVRDMRAPR